MVLEVKDTSNRVHKIKINKSVEWTVPYIKKARELGIPVWKISAVKGYCVPLEKSESQVGATHFFIDDKKINYKKKVVIMMLTKRQVTTSSGTPGLFMNSHYKSATEDHWFEQSIHTLAHELAHILDFHHTPERFIIEGKLFASFTKLAHKLGYKGY